MAKLKLEKSSSIKIHDKVFEIFIDDKELEDIIKKISEKINKSNIIDPVFLVVINGAFLFAADLIRKIKLKNLEVSFIKLASYEGTESTGKVNELIGINQSIKNRNIIIVEDIIDSGITLEKLIALIDKEEVASLSIATLLFKPKAYKKSFAIDFIGKKIENDFVVGYGLDYDELGRNLPCIYKLKE
jgi:hypoxanthine phosphoribosyltransferase|tara:strand:- start:13806 stop:14366 length:561 start_codon:yes stop_codon:yes gene_type:complete